MARGLLPLDSGIEAARPMGSDHPKEKGATDVASPGASVPSSVLMLVQPPASLAISMGVPLLTTSVIQ